MNTTEIEKLIVSYKVHLKNDRLKDEFYKWLSVSRKLANENPVAYKVCLEGLFTENILLIERNYSFNDKITL